ncbi:heat shock factor 2-binding protein-like [Schistocerca nitens]|uniref:heat shock factor 2-binding protein-like n=1 Tax=Schistocerca nitens TaxID=7011 RepID=UPI0021181AE5|nr:heat shock factor 2-binding protein-like [Schistocerca nitens]
MAGTGEEQVVPTRIVCELKELKKSYDALHKEWDYQQEQIDRAEEELQNLKFQLLSQSQYCAHVGSVIGNLIWKGARDPKFSEALLDSNLRRDFLYIISDALLSFMETYALELPPGCTEEAQFILSIVGAVANMAACPAGRQVLSGSDAARQLMIEFITYLPILPLPSGNKLKQLMLMALYNVSINKRGLRFLQQKTDHAEKLVQALGYVMRSDTAPEPRLTALRLLQSLTCDVASPVVIDCIDESISLPDLRWLLKNRATDDETKEVCKQIEDNLERARQRHGMKGRCTGAVPFDGCSFVRAQGELKPGNAVDKPWDR